MPKSFYLGVIEGFYGLPWGQEQRLAMMPWLARLGFQAYMYAPKADSTLRKAWQEPLGADELKQLRRLSGACHESGLTFVVGLSPYALYESYTNSQRVKLEGKVRQLVDAGVAGLALLFDDMPGNETSLAQRQIEICHDVEEWVGGVPLLMCPTYYSDDPVLDKFFGKRPEGYLEELGVGLSEAVELFWTGPQVCSDNIGSGDLESVVNALRRPVALWDNYPVNDSKVRSEHIYVQAVEGRDDSIRPFLSSHWSNAMNQPALSLPALASFVALHGQNVDTEVLSEAGVGADIQASLSFLAQTKRTELSDEAQESLKSAAPEGSMACQELVDWVDGKYEFDPACLTD